MASTDNIFAMVSFFVIAIIVIVFAVIWSGFSNIDVLWSQADVGGTIKGNTQSFVDSWDFIMVCMYFGLHLMILAFAFLLRSHPVVYISAILLTVVLVVIAAPISNVWNDTINLGTFSGISGDFGMLNAIMSKLPFYEFIWSILTMVVLFGFARVEGIV